MRSGRNTEEGKKGGGSALEAASSQLRALAFSTQVGGLIGGESDLVNRLNVSRATIRQAARVLEAEGLLSVRRGPSGGYFSARPNIQSLEGAFGAYLGAIKFDVKETFIVGHALWAEVVRQAAMTHTPEVKALTRRFRQRLTELPANAPFVDLYAFEDDYRRSLFQIVDRPFVELIFTLTRAIIWRHYTEPALGRGIDARNAELIHEWCKCKRFELDAIEEGDEALALIAAARDRSFWHERLFSATAKAKPRAALGKLDRSS